MRFVTENDGVTIAEINAFIAKASQVVMVTGAGISTSCGIPDFRSQGGMYSQNVQDLVIQLAPILLARTTRSDSNGYKERLELLKRRLISHIPMGASRMKTVNLFEVRVLQDRDTRGALELVLGLLRVAVKDGLIKPGASHMLMHRLLCQGRLLRCYTQNIDGLEFFAGLEYEELLEEPTMDDTGPPVITLHGNLTSARCETCGDKTRWPVTDFRPWARKGDERGRNCGRCADRRRKREREGKRQTGAGILRPNVILYGEEHPQGEMIGKVQEFDINLLPDVLLVMGTSLTVPGVQKMVKDFAKQVHINGSSWGKVIVVNRSRLSPGKWDGMVDYQIVTDCDRWAADYLSTYDSVGPVTGGVTQRQN